MINEDTRCGPADGWGVAVVEYWLAKRRGERAMRNAKERRAKATRRACGKHRRREVAQ